MMEVLVMTTYLSKLKEKIKDKTAKISVIGCGYVGTTLGVGFTQNEFKVNGYDTSRLRISQLSEMMDKPEYQLLRFNVTDDPFHIKFSDIVIITVPTPLSKRGLPDLSYIDEALKGLPSMKGKLVVLESTVPIGVTRSVVQKSLEKDDVVVGENCFLGFSPERVDPNNQDFTIHDVPKITSGISKGCADLTNKLYKKITKTVPVSSVECAEAVKLLENSSRMVGIALIQEFAQYASKIGLDIWEICEGANTKPYGILPLYPSAGVGGHCIGVDSTALAWSARQENFTLGLVEKALAVHNSVPFHIVGMVEKAIDTTQLSGLAGSKVLLVGASYKPEVADSRESACRDIWKLLEDRRATVQYYDPLIKSMHLTKDRTVDSISLTEKNIREVDCVVICQPFSISSQVSWEGVPLTWLNLFMEANAIVDCCNVYKKNVKFYFPKDESKRKVFSI